MTVRMKDGPPGEVAELDFGRLGLISDPESGGRPVRCLRYNPSSGLDIR